MPASHFPVHGAAHGPILWDPLLGTILTIDNGYYLPLAAAGFAALGITTPNSLWLCQEASGNLADSIGSLTLTANGTPLYQQTAGSFTRKGVGFSAAAAQRFAAASGSGPNPTTTSSVWLGLWQFGAAPASVACITSAGTTEQVRQTTTGKVRATSGANTSDSVTNYVNMAQFVALDYDRANSVARAVTESESRVPTYAAASADANKGFGDCVGTLVSPNGAKLVWACMWSGAAAEALNIQAVIATLTSP